MIVAVLTAELMVYDARSLKDKRRVIDSATQRLRQRFNVSVAQVAHGDSIKRCTLGMAIVSTDVRSAHARCDKMIELLKRNTGLSLLDYERTFV